MRTSRGRRVIARTGWPETARMRATSAPTLPVAPVTKITPITSGPNDRRQKIRYQTLSLRLIVLVCRCARTHQSAAGADPRADRQGGEPSLRRRARRRRRLDARLAGVDHAEDPPGEQPAGDRGSRGNPG